MRFTGHERDENGGVEGLLDYMHARHASPVVGRFLSVDPVLQVQRARRQPQLWNRFSYVLNNPLKYVDPKGKTLVLYYDGWNVDWKKALSDLRNTVPPELRMFVRARTLPDGRVVVDPRFLNAKKRAASGNFQALRQIANSPGTALFSSSVTSIGPETIGTASMTSGITFSTSQSSSGFVEAYVGSDLTAFETALTTAHELRHVRRFLLGLPALDEIQATWTQNSSGGTMTFSRDPTGPVNIETRAAEEEASRNYDPFIPQDF